MFFLSLNMERATAGLHVLKYVAALSIVLLRHNRYEDLDYIFSAVSKLEMYLHESARRNQTDLLTKIINKRNINLDCRNQLDRTALHMAVSHGNLSAVEQLVRAKATVEVTDKVRQIHASEKGIAL